MAATREFKQSAGDDSCIALLKGFVARHPPKSSEDINVERDVDQQLRRIFEARRQKEAESKPSLSQIPRFFSPAPKEGSVEGLLRQIARDRFLKRQREELLLDDDLRRLAHILTEHKSPPEGNSERINYEKFRAIGELFPAAYAFFTASTFFKFRRDKYGRISSHTFFKYVCRKTNMTEFRIDLTYHDQSGKGFLTEHDLDNYMISLIPQWPALQAQNESFYSFYAFTAVRKFLFYLDPRRTGRVRIRDMITSPVMEELRELKSEEQLTGDRASSNWFSPTAALNVYSYYLSLDQDHNGLLNPEELAQYGSASFTKTFIARVFQECRTYDGEMDYKVFLDFHLAMTHKKTKQALQYFWRLLDIRKNGRLDSFSINYFLREVLERYTQLGYDQTNVADVKDEIFDMVKPADPMFITYADLVACCKGAVVVDILTEVMGFYRYDQRESLISEENEEEQQQDEEDPFSTEDYETIASLR